MTSITEGLSAWCLGQFEMARRVLEHPRLPESALAYARFMRAFALCWLQAEDGELELALTNAETYVAMGRSIHHHHEARHRWLLAETLRRHGDLERAKIEAMHAIAKNIH